MTSHTLSLACYQVLSPRGTTGSENTTEDTGISLYRYLPVGAGPRAGSLEQGNSSEGPQRGLDRSCNRNEHPPEVHHHPMPDALFIDDLVEVVIILGEEHRRMGKTGFFYVAALQNHISRNRICPDAVQGQVVSMLADELPDQLGDSLDSTLVVVCLFHNLTFY